MYYNPLRNTVSDGEKVSIDNQCYIIMMISTGYCLKNENGILISGLKEQGELCNFLNKKNAERVY